MKLPGLVVDAFFRKASIAFGYTPNACLLGALPRTPEKTVEQEKKMKDKKFAFRINQRDLNAIRTKAEQAKMTVTDYLVACALGKRIVVVEDLPWAVSEMKAIGRNLNQLVTLANMGRITSVRLDEVREMFAKTYELLFQIAGRGR